MQEEVEQTTFDRAIAAIETATCGPDEGAPSCNEYRLRPSEQAALLLDRSLHPPPPWGIKINMSRSFLGPEKCILLGKKLMLNKTVTYLDISMCDMQEEAGEKFFLCLQDNTMLKHLCVNGNYLGDRGAIAAAPCLKKLESFHCASNGITDVGAAALADGMRRSATLKTLSVRNNRITIEGIQKLIDALLEPPADEAAQEDPPAGDAENAESAGNPESIKNPPVILSGEGMEGEVLHDSPVEGPTKAEGDLTAADTIVEEPTFNETLHTLWIDQNVAIPEDVFLQLATILAKRFPKPPETKKKRKKAAK